MTEEPNYPAIFLVLIMPCLLAMIIGGRLFSSAIEQVVEIFRSNER